MKQPINNMVSHVKVTNYYSKIEIEVLHGLNLRDMSEAKDEIE